MAKKALKKHDRFFVPMLEKKIWFCIPLCVQHVVGFVVGRCSATHTFRKLGASPSDVFQGPDGRGPQLDVTSEIFWEEKHEKLSPCNGRRLFCHPRRDHVLIGGLKSGLSIGR